MQKVIIKMIRYISFVLSIVLFAFGMIINDISILNYAVIFIWINNICFSLEQFYDRIFFFAFQITFFTFLMGRTLSGIFLVREDYYNFPNDILVHTEICLYIALFALFAGYCLFRKVRISHKIRENKLDYESVKYRVIRRISKYLYWGMLPFSILVIVEKAVYVYVRGYANYYVDYSSRFPYFVTKFGDICPLAFYIFLATMPPKKEVKIPTIVFVIRAVLLMFTGKRADFIVPILLLGLYFARRNEINSGGEKWLKSKYLRYCVIVLPVVLVVLSSYNTIRFNLSEESSNKTFFESMIGFFDNTGFSVNVISFEKLYEDSIPDKIYSFGDTTDYLRENMLTQLFFDLPVYKTQTAEKAMYGNNFSQTITYIRSPSYFLSGRGYGSSYIAEAYHDFGYLGIVFWSFLYSFILARVYSLRGKGIIYVTMALQALHYILVAPRNMASAFISEYINIYTWIVIGMVFFVAKIMVRRQGFK